MEEMRTGSMCAYCRHQQSELHEDEVLRFLGHPFYFYNEDRLQRIKDGVWLDLGPINDRAIQNCM